MRVLHPYIISLYSAWKDAKYVYLALEWAPRGNLLDFLVSRGGRLREEEAATIVVKPLFSALAFLHSQNFIHRCGGGSSMCTELMLELWWRCRMYACPYLSIHAALALSKGHLPHRFIFNLLQGYQVGEYPHGCVVQCQAGRFRAGH